MHDGTIKRWEFDNGCKFQVLTIKRSDRTAAIKDQCVFPGGIFERTDENEEWLEYFKEFGVSESDLLYLILPHSVPRPHILETPLNIMVARYVFYERVSFWFY